MRVSSGMSDAGITDACLNRDYGFRVRDLFIGQEQGDVWHQSELLGIVADMRPFPGESYFQPEIDLF